MRSDFRILGAALVGWVFLALTIAPAAESKGQVTFRMCGDLGCVGRERPQMTAAMLYGGRLHPGPGCGTPVYTVTTSTPYPSRARRFLLVASRGLIGERERDGNVWWRKVGGARKGELAKGVTGAGIGFRAQPEFDGLLADFAVWLGIEGWNLRDGRITCSGTTPARDSSPAQVAKSGISVGIVTCRAAILGQGPREWRRESIVAGPVAARRSPPPLGAMAPSRGGTMVIKMGLMVVGHEPVRVAPKVPGRVRLYYGRKADSFNEDAGHTSVVFYPCEDQQRTIYPGGIRVKGRQPVHLEVGIVGSKVTRPLNLGRPKLLGG